MESGQVADSIAPVVPTVHAQREGAPSHVFVENAKKFGTYCGKNPSISIVNAAEAVLGK